MSLKDILTQGPSLHPFPLACSLHIWAEWPLSNSNLCVLSHGSLAQLELLYERKSTQYSICILIFCILLLSSYWTDSRVCLKSSIINLRVTERKHFEDSTHLKPNTVLSQSSSLMEITVIYYLFCQICFLWKRNCCLDYVLGQCQGSAQMVLYPTKGVRRRWVWVVGVPSAGHWIPHMVRFTQQKYFKIK